MQKQSRTGRLFAALGVTGLIVTFVAGCDSRVAVRGPRIVLPTVPTPGVTPTGDMATEVRPIAGVNAVSLKAVGIVDIALGQSESLTITAPERVISLLTSEVSGGRLDLARDSASYTGQVSDIHYEIGLRQLDELMLEGTGQIDVRGLNNSRFVARLNGVGDVKVAGRTDRQEVRVAGLGDYRGAMLESRSADVHLSSGRAEIWATERIEGWIGFGSTLELWGDPVVSVQGPGRVIQHGAKY